MQCPLCLHSSMVYLPRVYRCEVCRLIFKDPADHLTASEESARYRHHRNHADEGYKNFLNRLLLPLRPFLSASFSALDFGCGPGPVLSEMLREIGAKVSLYDPQFYPDETTLHHNFDVVTCTEVVEHFRDPNKSWEILVSKVRVGGILAVMTQLVAESTDYPNWWYKNDPTHMVFYGEDTMKFLATKYHLEILYNDHHSVLIFKKL